jgi:hypothetical protein
MISKHSVALWDTPLLDSACMDWLHIQLYTRYNAEFSSSIDQSNPWPDFVVT